MKVLVVAQDCNPAWYSVPLVGWNHAFGLRAHCEVHLATHGWNREGIGRSAWPAGEITYIDHGWVDRFHAWALHEIFKDQFGKASYTLFRMPIYWNFERLVWKRLGKRIAAKEWDVVHRVTPVSPANSGPLAAHCRRAGVPYVHGPINGGLPWPKGYKNALHKEREWISAFRFLFHHMPYIRSDRENAAALLLASRVTWSQLPEQYRSKAFYLPENGIHARQVRTTPREAPQGPLRLAFLGRLVPLKCVDLAIKAAAPLLKAGQATFDIIGDGSEKAYLQALAQGLPGVTFHGELPNAKALELLATTHVLAFPSVREFGGGVVVEAMANGVVPVVMNYGGPGEIVDDASGIRLPLEDDGRTEARLAAAFAALAADPAQVQRLAEGARQRALSAWTWEAKVLKTLEIYRYVTGAQNARPALLPPP
jgi:glycosyltransferase involved in cell wall biosynthesis